MQKEKLVPAIRFKGFDKEYITNKTIDILNIERGASPRPINNYLAKNGINWVKISDAPTTGYYITQTEDKIITDGIKFSKRVFPGDLILSNSMSFGRPYIMGIPGCIHDGWLKITDIDNKFDSVYLCTLFGTEQMIKKYKSLAAGSTVNNLNKELVASTQISYPAFEEQQKISKFFSNLDSLIHLQELKLENLQTIKQSLLDKMFALYDQKVPEIRFKGFDESWKLNKFSDLYNCSNEKNINIRYSEKNIISVANMYFKDEQKISNAEYLKSYNIFHLGDIAYEGNKSANYRYGRFVVNTIGSGIVSHVFEVFKPVMKEYDLYFWKYYINSESIMRNVLRDSTKSTTMMATLVKKDLSNQFIKITSIAEQQKIGQFFSSLDSIIHYQEQKLEKINNLKQALLEKMFC
ncbi:restriction endonuclease subunit S [Mycoplasma sp. SK341A]|uniref:restriction endonuclease subunit S n=1 Tax=Mycoplasma sp. SK341A TaxID=3401679 RepID=UPI003AB06C45